MESAGGCGSFALTSALEVVAPAGEATWMDSVSANRATKTVEDRERLRTGVTLKIVNGVAEKRYRWVAGGRMIG
jgi:hypothetical protein